MPERWADIPGYEHKYQASDKGQIRSVDREVNHPFGRQKLRGKLLKQNTDKAGYKRVTLHNNGGERKYVHRLVLETFVGKPEEHQETRHLNGVRTDNRLENLAWGTSSENNFDIVRHGNHIHASRETCKHGHQKIEANTANYSKAKGHRVCLACSRARTYHRNHPELKISFKQLADKYYESITESK